MPQLDIPVVSTQRNTSSSPLDFQHLGTLDLFNDLILDRGKVHQDLRRPSTIRTVACKTEDSSQSSNPASQAQTVYFQSAKADLEPAESSALRSYLGINEMTIKKPKAKPAKKALAKGKSAQASRDIAIRKRGRPALGKNERASKVQKRHVNSLDEGKVNGSGESADDAYIISDGDDDSEHSDQNGKMDRLPSHRQTIKIDCSDDRNNGTPRMSPALESKSEVDHKLTLARVQAAHTEELEHVRQQHEALITNLKQAHEQDKQDALEAQHEQKIASEKLFTDLWEELEAEKSISYHLSWECDDWKRKFENAKECLERQAPLVSQRDDYERLYQEGRHINAELVRSHTEKNEEWMCKESKTAQEIQQLAKEIDELRLEVVSLKNENEALRASALSQASQHRSSVSPAPSQLSGVSDHEQRLANVRKIYIKVKKKYDNLFSVATNISIATRLWNHNDFGQFGQYLKQLKTVLDDNKAEG